MYRKILLITTLLLLFSQAYAENKYANVVADRLTIYSKPSTNADITGLLGKGSGVQILEKKNGWVKIKLPEGATGYVKNQGLRATSKKPEADSTDKQISKLLDKFSRTVRESDYAKNTKIFPTISLTTFKDSNEVTFMYSAVNSDGKKIPSLKRNPLAKNMRELIELSFLKMMKQPAKEYKITVETPYFGENGVVNGTSIYAVFTLSAEKEQIKNIEQGKISVWNQVQSSRKLAQVFEEYPH